MPSGKQYELAIKIAGKVDNSFRSATKAAQSQLSSFASGAKTIIKGIAIAGAAVTTAATAAGKALYDLGEEFDAAYDTIRVGTGATGEALEDLKDSMKAVYTSVPAEMGDAAQAISDYNTRLGVTGDTLEALSSQALQVSSMLDEDLDTVIESSSTAFQNWQIAEEKMAGAMDWVFRVSQSTGVGFTKLMGNLQSYGAQLQAAGYGFEESAVLLGQVEKAGYDASTVFTALKTAAKNAANDGFDNVNEGLQSYIDQIKNAGSETEAYNIACTVFGSKAAATMISAINSGALSLEELQSQLEASSETISAAAKDTYDFADRFELFKNKMKVALEPMAMELFDSMTDAIVAVEPTITAILPIITGAITGILPAIQGLVPLIVAIAGQLSTDVLPLLSQIIQSILPPFAQLLQSILPIFMQLIRTALPPIIALVQQMLPPLVQITQAILPIISALIQSLSPVLTALMAAVQPILDVAIQLLTPLAGIIAKLAPIITLIGSLASIILTAMAPAISFAADLIGTVLNAAIAGLGPVLDNVTAILSGLIDFITNVFAGNWGAAWDSIVSVFGNIFGGIVNIAKIPINAVISAINWVIEKINGVSIDIPDWVPGLGGTHFGLSIPTIPALAAGGIATTPTLAMIGEGEEPEAVLPLSKLAEMLGDGRGNGGGDDFNSFDQSETITFAPVFNFYGPVTKEDAEEAGRISFAEFKRLYRQMKAEERRKSFAMA